MKEKNPCIEAGCRAACCGNIFLKDSRGVITRSFPGAIELPYDDLPSNNDALPNGVYFTDYNAEGESGMALARIVGPCPNLGEEANCTIYERRPNACANFSLGSPKCLDMRAEYRKQLKKEKLSRQSGK